MNLEQFRKWVIKQNLSDSWYWNVHYRLGGINQVFGPDSIVELESLLLDKKVPAISFSHGSWGQKNDGALALPWIIVELRTGGIEAAQEALVFERLKLEEQIDALNGLIEALKKQSAVRLEHIAILEQRIERLQQAQSTLQLGEAIPEDAPNVPHAAYFCPNCNGWVLPRFTTESNPMGGIALNTGGLFTPVRLLNQSKEIPICSRCGKKLSINAGEWFKKQKKK